jgi:hypothetical protein
VRHVTLVGNAQNGLGTAMRGSSRVVVNVFDSLIAGNSIDGAPTGMLSQH